MTALREDGQLEVLAVLADAGLGERYLEARYPDELRVLEAAAEEIRDLHAQRAKDLARSIRNEIVEAFQKG